MADDSREPTDLWVASIPFDQLTDDQKRTLADAFIATYDKLDAGAAQDAMVELQLRNKDLSFLVHCRLLTRAKVHLQAVADQVIGRSSRPRKRHKRADIFWACFFIACVIYILCLLAREIH